MCWLAFSRSGGQPWSRTGRGVSAQLAAQGKPAGECGEQTATGRHSFTSDPAQRSCGGHMFPRLSPGASAGPLLPSVGLPFTALRLSQAEDPVGLSTRSSLPPFFHIYQSSFCLRPSPTPVSSPLYPSQRMHL